jgi:5-methyltetrahydropteroyltriglutamate--homocysteine methyltransferase
MKRSTDRILTTHVGSLPRPLDLLDMIKAKGAGKPLDAAAFETRVRSAVSELVKEQVAHGLDIIDDGEAGKVGFIPYVNERLSGFEPSPKLVGGSYWGNSREVKAFPEYYDWASKQPGAAGNVGSMRWACTAPISYKGHKQVQRDIDNLRAAIKGVREPADVFMPAISPSNIEDWHKNEHYKTQEDYLFAIADAMHEEYKAIADAGFLLQVDDPVLATYWILHPELSLEQVRAWAKVRVEALNRALKGIPREKIRYHTCYSINIGPRVHDMEMKDLVDVMLGVNAGAYSFEAANPRHEHEWKVWETVKLPDDRILVPGVITHCSNIVEHPELIAQRLGRFANIVGRERVIAGADCGFASFASTDEIHRTVVWAKFDALVEGARIATKQLWGRA